MQEKASLFSRIIPSSDRKRSDALPQIASGAALAKLPPVPRDYLASLVAAMKEMQKAKMLYRPDAGSIAEITKMMEDFELRGLEKFKSWPSAGKSFFARYGDGYTDAIINAGFKEIVKLKPNAAKAWMYGRLCGNSDAQRDYDLIRATWNQTNWPFELVGYGESAVGAPQQHFLLEPNESSRFGRTYLTYLMALAALSEHVAKPPRSFIEIGGGYGVLGEILGQRDSGYTYIDIDIAPLVIVAAYYLRQLFGDQAVTDFAEFGRSSRSTRFMCLGSWQIEALKQPADVFVNIHGFDEMEPAVAENYIDKIVNLGVPYVVSLNSREGKYGGKGVIDSFHNATTSEMIRDWFRQRGYRELPNRLDNLTRIRSELAILARV